MVDHSNYIYGTEIKKNLNTKTTKKGQKYMNLIYDTFIGNL